MIDPKIETFLKLCEIGNFTKTAKAMNLSQPAVSHQIKLLEEEFHIKIFYPYRSVLTLTPEGEILCKYAKRVASLSAAARQALEDSKRHIGRFVVGVTPTISNFVVSKVLVAYCNEHPDTHIQILTDTIQNIDNKLHSFELDWAIVEGSIASKSCRSILLDTDFLCVVASPQHPFAQKSTIGLEQLKQERLILRPQSTGTRALFENYLFAHSQSIEDFNVVIEIDDVAATKDLVMQNFGLSVMAHSACKEEIANKQLVMIPVQDCKMIREINLVYHHDFIHTEVLKEIQRLFTLLQG